MAKIAFLVILQPVGGWSQLDRMVTNWFPEGKKGKPQCANAAQASACGKFVNVPLASTNHKAEPIFKGWRN